MSDMSDDEHGEQKQGNVDECPDYDDGEVEMEAIICFKSNSRK